ncbi:ATP-binding cassette domain-containing protein [Streptomyces sp. NPDC001728]|uniref:ATP-binding cassette domain-containing protein n=1 Tax=Streptomyces sp. NPDC001728 TaxID=3154396 RepID=UPI003319FBBB
MSVTRHERRLLSVTRHERRLLSVTATRRPPGGNLDNALFDLRHLVRASRTELHDRVEQALREAGLWSEVSHRLDTPAQTLSKGRRQRLCLARALALEPAALLLDGSTSALDARSRYTVEESVAALRGDRPVLLVSHDPAQVERLCDRTVRIDLPNACEPSPAAVRALAHSALRARWGPGGRAR